MTTCESQRTISGRNKLARGRSNHEFTEWVDYATLQESQPNYNYKEMLKLI